MFHEQRARRDGPTADPLADTAEGLEASLTTRYYSRLRIAQLLLPLLDAAASPHVVSVLAGGQEGALQEDDLGLARPPHFTVARAAVHSATMGTLALEKLAAAHPRVSFVHTYPGIVDTPLFGRMATAGLLGLLVRCLLAPLVRLFARPVAEAGQLGLFFATSGRYSVDGGGLVPPGDAGGAAALEKGARSNGGQGIFLVGAGGECVENERVLAPLRKKDMERKVWEHTEAVFARVR